MANPAGASPEAAAAAKARLRAEVAARRAARTAAERRRVADALARRGLARCAGVAVIAAYASYGSEPGTGPLRAALIEVGTTVLLPVVRGEDLLWVIDAGHELHRRGERSMPEPTGPAVGSGSAGLLAAGVGLVLLPAMAASLDGIRLGKGGGYYDRLLARLPVAPAGPQRIAVLHDDEVLPAGTVPAERHDLLARVDEVLTPDL